MVEMHCVKCGALIDGDRNYCPNCGTKTIQTKEKLIFTPEISQKKVASSPEVNISNKPLVLINGMSMKWFNFFVKYFIPFRIILMIIALINEIQTGLLSDSYGILQVSGEIILFGNFALILLLFLSSGPLKKYKRIGFQYITRYFFLQPLLFILINGFNLSLLMSAHSLSISDVSELLALIIAKLLGIATVSIPNLIYFYKRKHIFIN